MLRFLKKRVKPSKKPVPPENPTHCQFTDIGGGNSGGEHRSREISEADEADGTDSTIAPDLNHGGDGGGSRITNHDGRVEDQRLPAPNASTPTPGDERVNTSERGQL